MFVVLDTQLKTPLELQEVLIKKNQTNYCDPVDLNSSWQRDRPTQLCTARHLGGTSSLKQNKAKNKKTQLLQLKVHSLKQSIPFASAFKMRKMQKIETHLFYELKLCTYTCLCIYCSTQATAHLNSSDNLMTKHCYKIVLLYISLYTN